MKLTIISGGQTGLDQAALRAARACGLPTGGFAPKGWKTEDGPAPWLEGFGLSELPQPGYPERTRANVYWCQALLWVGDPSSAGGRLTLRLADGRRIPLAQFPNPSEPGLAPAVASAIRAMLPGGGNLLVARNRESKAPGIGAAAERLLLEAFGLLKAEQSDHGEAEAKAEADNPGA